MNGAGVISELAAVVAAILDYNVDQGIESIDATNLGALEALREDIQNYILATKDNPSTKLRIGLEIDLYKSYWGDGAPSDRWSQAYVYTSWQEPGMPRGGGRHEISAQMANRLGAVFGSAGYKRYTCTAGWFGRCSEHSTINDVKLSPGQTTILGDPWSYGPT